MVSYIQGERTSKETYTADNGWQNIHVLMHVYIYKADNGWLIYDI